MSKRTVTLLTAFVVMLPLTMMSSAYAAADSLEFSVEQLYEQVTVLQVASTLQLTSEQITQLLPVLTEIQEKQTELLSSTDQIWQQYSGAIQSAIAAQLAGQRVSAEVSQAAHAGLTNAGKQREAFYHFLASSAAALLQSYLTAQQRQLIAQPRPTESPAQSALALEGAGSLAEYIVGVIDTQRDLMPDEYELVRIPTAQRIAAKIVPPNSPQFEQVTGQVLQLTDSIYDQPQDQYIQQYPTLADQVAQYLQLPAPSAEPPISYQQLLDFLSSPYTIPLLQRMAALATTQPLPTDTRHIEDCLIFQAAEVIDIVGLFDYLQLSVQQLSATVPVTQQIEAILQPIRKPTANQGQSLKDTLLQVRDSLLGGGQVPPEWQQFQTKLQQQRRQARQQIARQLNQVQRMLLPGQNQLIDWQPPLDILATDSKRLAREQIRILAEMRTVVDVLERLRFRQMQDYQRTRIVELNRLLERYDITQDSPAYPHFRSFGIEILNEMRQTPWEQWEQARVLLAIRFLRELGVIDEISASPATQRPITWEDMFTALTYPKVSLVIQQMITARSTGQVPQQPIPLGGQTQQPQGDNR